MSQRRFFFFSCIVASILFCLFLASPTALATSTHTTRASTINTNVLCAPTYFLYYITWPETNNGPSGFGCGGHAWQTTTPTQSNAQYNMGTINGSANYTLRAFITDQATAPMNYDISVGNTVIKSCFLDQAKALAWTTVCSFSVSSSSNGQPLIIAEWSGAVHTYTLSASAIQI